MWVDVHVLRAAGLRVRGAQGDDTFFQRDVAPGRRAISHWPDAGEGAEGDGEGEGRCVGFQDAGLVAQLRAGTL